MESATEPWPGFCATLPALCQALGARSKIPCRWSRQSLHTRKRPNPAPRLVVNREEGTRARQAPAALVDPSLGANRAEQNVHTFERHAATARAPAVPFLYDGTFLPFLLREILHASDAPRPR